MMCKSIVATFQADYGSICTLANFYFCLASLCTVSFPVLGEAGPRST